VYPDIAHEGLRAIVQEKGSGIPSEYHTENEKAQ